ncbi:hypothetical protein V1525DRAFT_341471 [Lipomyces kononenkoae]|uniref:Uncharacterized protein n=1 Tax=Lipomyces kononenkoae TaxID=34357 RepID=A0ACC3T3G3_LIPKO
MTRSSTLRIWAIALVTALVVASTARAQVYPMVNVSTIDPATRQQWCQSEVASCPLICLDEGYGYTSNLCYPDNLYYTCVCANGLSPNLTQYSLTIPYFLCTEQVSLCASNCGSDNACVSACRQNKPCGATDPTRVNVTTTSSASASASGSDSGSASTPTTASPSTSSAAVYYGFGTSAVESPSPTKNAAAASAGRIMFDNNTVRILGVSFAGAALWTVVGAGLACALVLGL